MIVQRTLIIILCILFLPIPAGAEEGAAFQTVSFKEYLSQVLEYYPTLKKENAAVEKTIAQKAIAASSRMPQLWASVGMEHGDDPVFTFGSLLRQNRFTNDDFALGRLNTPSPVTNYSAGVEGQWLLFDFSQTSSRIRSSGLLGESAQFNAEFARMEAILAASELYSRLAAVDAFLEVLEEMVSLNQRDIGAVESLARSGLALGADFYLANMAHNQLVQLKNETVAQRAALALAFNILRGEDPSRAVALSVNYGKTKEVDGSVEEWIAKAVNGRLDIKSLGKVLDSQGIEISREKKSFLPKIVAFGRAEENLHSTSSTEAGNYVVGVKAKMDLFDPGQGSRVKMAQEESNRLRAQWQEMRDNAAADTAEVFYRLQAIKDNEQLSSQIYSDSKEAMKLMAPLYKEGRKSIAEMVNVRISLIHAYDQWLKLETLKRNNILTLKFYAGEMSVEEAEGLYE